MHEQERHSTYLHKCYSVLNVRRFSYYSLIFFSFFYKLININANALQYELNNEANWQKTKCFLGQSEPRFTVH